MRRFTVAVIVLSLLIGAELVAKKVDNVTPPPLVWDTQFTQDKALQISWLGDQIDVVFAGSSVAQANLDPEIFVETSPLFDSAYNAGIPSVTPRVWREFLLDTVYRETCPSVVIIAVDIRQFNDNKPGAIDQLWRYLAAPGRLEQVGERDIWRNSENWLKSKFALFRVRARLREPDKVVAWIWDIGEKADWRNTNLSASGRYMSNDKRTYEASQERLDKLARGAFKDFAVGGVETEAIRQMLEDATSRGATPILVEMPAMNTTLATALPNGSADLHAYTEALQNVADGAGIAFIRLPEFDDDAVFYSDDYHMNFTGIDAVTRALAERIAALDLDIGAGVCSPTE